MEKRLIKKIEIEQRAKQIEHEFFKTIDVANDVQNQLSILHQEEDQEILVLNAGDTIYCDECWSSCVKTEADHVCKNCGLVSTVPVFV